MISIKKAIFQLFCNHTEQKCMTDFSQSYYINDIAKNGVKSSKMQWRCERCGKILYRKYIDSSNSTINWMR